MIEGGNPQANSLLSERLVAAGSVQHTCVCVQTAQVEPVDIVCLRMMSGTILSFPFRFPFVCLGLKSSQLYSVSMQMPKIDLFKIL
jgi:hypothetical protein